MRLVVIALGWLAGIVAVAAWNAPWWMGGLWFLAIAPAVLASKRKHAAAWLVAGAVASLIAGYRFDSWENRGLPSLASELDSEVVLSGHVASEPDPGITTVSYRLEVDEVIRKGGLSEQTDGAVLIRVGQFTDFRPGDRIEVAGEIEAPAELDFDYRGYLLRKGIVGTMLFPDVTVIDQGGPSPGRLLTAVRLRLDGVLARSLPEPEASLGAGIFLGRDQGIPDDLYEDFREAGLAHLVAVSGGNVILVMWVFLNWLPGWLGRRPSIVAAGIVALGYVALAGASPSVLRSGLMAMVFLIGWVIGRPQAGLPALGAAMLFMTAFSPGIALDLGFQLSLAATAGLIVFMPWVSNMVHRALRRAKSEAVIPDMLVDAFALTIVATVATMPIIWVAFGRISLVSPLANVAAAPLFVAAFAGVAITSLAGLIGENLGWAAGLGAYYPLAGLTWLADTAARPSFAAIDAGGGTATLAVFAYAGLAILAWPAYRYLPPEIPRPVATVGDREVRFVLAGVTVTVLAAIAWFVSFAPLTGPGELKLQVLDVGQGDAILLTTPEGRRVLVDGGPAGISLARELGAALPHWARTIDTIILTHGDQDHVAGLARLNHRYDVGNVYSNGMARSTVAYREFEANLGATEVLAAGDALEIDGVRLEVLWPPRDNAPSASNEGSLVLRISYGTTSFLLTGDIQGDAQSQLARTAGLASDVLKVPHHGSKTNDRVFLDAAGARLALISAGEGNQFGHPALETLNALGETTTYRTDLDGRISLLSDGRRIRVSSER